jgi:hypothetical protein
MGIYPSISRQRLWLIGFQTCGFFPSFRWVLTLKHQKYGDMIDMIDKRCQRPMALLPQRHSGLVLHV